MDINGHVRIGDYGLAKPGMDEDQFAYSFCGSPEYMAPEMLMKQGHSYSIDYYCLGALLYELVFGLPPFYSRDTDLIYERILKQEIEFPPRVNISPQLKSLLKSLLDKNPEARLGAQAGIREILSHEWFGNISMKKLINKELEPPI